MSKFTVTLKQHTPIIHFQPNQIGATLRATQIKSALKRIYNTDKKFQLKVILKKSSDPLPIEKDMQYFGDINIRDGNKLKKIFTEKSISLEVNTYFDQDLKIDLENNIEIALALYNFGTRSNKGTGCYFNEKKTQKEFEQILKDNIKKNIYHWDCDNPSSAFLSMKLIYLILKSGITVKSKDASIRTDYPSMLYQYFLDKGVTWERSKIKKVWGVGHNTRTEIPLMHTTEFKFIRVLLGSGEIQSWMPEKLNISIEFPKEFERIPSCLQFKVFNHNSKTRIYFWASDIYKKILNKDFKFTSNSKAPIDIKSPNEFDIDNFLEYSINKISRLSVNNSSGNDILTEIKKIRERIKSLPPHQTVQKKNLERTLSSCKAVYRIDYTLDKLKTIGIKIL